MVKWRKDHWLCGAQWQCGILLSLHWAIYAIAAKLIPIFYIHTWILPSPLLLFHCCSMVATPLIGNHTLRLFQQRLYVCVLVLWKFCFFSGRCGFSVTKPQKWSRWWKFLFCAVCIDNYPFDALISVGPPLLLPLYFHYEVIYFCIKRKDYFVSVCKWLYVMTNSHFSVYLWQLAWRVCCC